jgi:hypothetical protein
MNERIREFAKQAGAKFYADTILVNGKDADDLMRKFAELIIKECAQVASDYDGAHYVGDAIEQHFGVM